MCQNNNRTQNRQAALHCDSPQTDNLSTKENKDNKIIELPENTSGPYQELNKQMNEVRRSNWGQESYKDNSVPRQKVTKQNNQ